MKTTLLSIFWVFCLSTYGQTSDILYVPNQKSLVLSYNNNHNPIGFYIGGYFCTSFPQPYIYTTPISFINRAGVNLVIFNNSISVMGGGYFESYVDSLSIQPDIWIRFNPLRTFLKTPKGFDFSVGVNYMKGFRYGVGLSIPFRGIY